jgi:hypothetical protein
MTDDSPARTGGLVLTDEPAADELVAVVAQFLREAVLPRLDAYAKVMRS